MTGAGPRVALAAALLALAPARSVAESPAASSSTTTCSPTRVHREANVTLGTLNGGRWVAAAPASAGIIGFLFGGEEVNGRLAVYAGGQNPVSGGSEKILWLVDPGVRVGPSLRIVGRRLHGRGSFRQTVYEGFSAETPGHDFPSIIDAPRAGCWRLRLRTRNVSARVIVLVQPPPG
jgi:hypothetical protein